MIPIALEYRVESRNRTIPCGLDLERAKRLADQSRGSVWQRTEQGWRPWPFVDTKGLPCSTIRVAKLEESEPPAVASTTSEPEAEVKAFDGQPRCKSRGTRGECQRPATNGDYCNKHFRKLFGHVFKRVDVGEYVCELCDQTFSCENNCACPKRDVPGETQRETCTATLPDGNRCRHHQHRGDLCGHHFRMFRAHQNELIGAGKFRCKHCGRKFDSNSMDECPARTEQARAQEKRVDKRRRLVDEVIARALAVKSLREEAQAAEQELERVRGLLVEAEREIEAMLPAERC